MHPLDVIKTRSVKMFCSAVTNNYFYRFQIQRGPDDPSRYTSLIDCVKKMIQNEG